MARWVNDGVLQANATEMLVNYSEMSVGSYTHFTIIDEHFNTINEHFTFINEHFSSLSLKFTIIRSSDHHWEAALTAISLEPECTKMDKFDRYAFLLCIFLEVGPLSKKPKQKIEKKQKH